VNATDERGAALDTPDELIEPFITATASTLREMSGVESVVRDSFRATGAEGLADVTVGLRLDASVEWWVVLSFPSATAAALTGRVLPGVERDEDMIRDCAAEFLNVIAGQAKTLLYGTPGHFTFSTPTGLTAGAPELAPGRSVVRFDSEAGPFTLHLCPPIATVVGDGVTSSTRAGG
jgi:CheY-specific phosphatase CheX